VFHTVAHPSSLFTFRKLAILATIIAMIAVFSTGTAAASSLVTTVDLDSTTGGNGSDDKVAVSLAPGTYVFTNIDATYDAWSAWSPSGPWLSYYEYQVGSAGPVQISGPTSNYPLAATALANAQDVIVELSGTTTVYFWIEDATVQGGDNAGGLSIRITKVAPFTDGSLEINAPGLAASPWQVGGDGVNWLSGWNTPDSGLHAVDLNADNAGSQGSVSQSFFTVPGHGYQVVFSISANPQCEGTTPTSKTLIATAGGASLLATSATPTSTNTSALVWTTKSFTFLADASGVATLKFQSTETGACGPLVDGVLVTMNNAAPSANAGGPYTVNEGSSVGVSGSGVDPENDAITYAWDLDNNGSFETPGQSSTFSAAGISGPATRTIRLQACDPYNGCSTGLALVTVNDVAPTLTVGPGALYVEDGPAP
jgi:hypothetical protein